MKVLTKNISSDQSCKYLWQLSDQHSVESILFRLNDSISTCISSQIGCNVGCIFCETGKQRNIRNLSVQEIYDQVDIAIRDHGQKILFKSVIFAGMGEPLLNFENVKDASRKLLQAELTESITITTSGIVPKIRELHHIPIERLSISLHATTNEKRSQIIPINNRFPIEDILGASYEYYKKTMTPITINYLLFDNFNDSDEDLYRMIELIDNEIFDIKLKQWNYVDDVALNPSSRMQHFHRELEHADFRVTSDFSKGTDVAGGCGQLRSLHRQLKKAREKQ